MDLPESSSSTASCSYSILTASSADAATSTASKPKTSVHREYGIDGARSELNVLMRKSCATARERVLFGAAEW
jgi:hypothetical protein